MRNDIGTDVIAGEPQFTAFQEISFSFEAIVVRQMEHFITVICKPRFIMGRFALSNVVTKTANNKLAVPGEAGVGGEDQIRQARLGVEEFDFGIELEI